ncbi:hypothetical protein BJ508DRAFT_333817 [Ascobolus immersus RN42]|uniref:Uncharacterized protein n=1 Tax=Ascobolus immersus RN42 TaxID=1160509 RepID=A0A3N4HIA9_ASCIM|nr:hypothetical protein BJ508DRAFT_333817 [Ascobolus immersus RN42]
MAKRKPNQSSPANKDSKDAVLKVVQRRIDRVLAQRTSLTTRVHLLSERLRVLYEERIALLYPPELPQEPYIPIVFPEYILPVTSESLSRCETEIAGYEAQYVVLRSQKLLQETLMEAWNENLDKGLFDDIRAIRRLGLLDDVGQDPVKMFEVLRVYREGKKNQVAKTNIALKVTPAQRRRQIVQQRRNKTSTQAAAEEPVPPSNSPPNPAASSESLTTRLRRLESNRSVFRQRIALFNERARAQHAIDHYNVKAVEDMISYDPCLTEPITAACIECLEYELKEHEKQFNRLKTLLACQEEKSDAADRGERVSHETTEAFTKRLRRLKDSICRSAPAQKGFMKAV